MFGTVNTKEYREVKSLIEQLAEFVAEQFTSIKGQFTEGYPWKDPDAKAHAATLKSEDLPDHIIDVEDNILEQVIACAHEGKCKEQCAVAFKITPQELQLYRKLTIPLPRICSNCRHYGRLKQRNPMELWNRNCLCEGDSSGIGTYRNTASHFHGVKPCPNEFETSYAPDRPEIVYCEQCYQAEVA